MPAGGRHWRYDVMAPGQTSKCGTSTRTASRSTIGGTPYYGVSSDGSAEQPRRRPRDPASTSAGSDAGTVPELCQQRLGTTQQILHAADTGELRDMLEYANRFHDTNTAWETVRIKRRRTQGLRGARAGFRQAMPGGPLPSDEEFLALAAVTAPESDGPARLWRPGARHRHRAGSPLRLSSATLPAPAPWPKNQATRRLTLRPCLTHNSPANERCMA